MSNRDSLGFGDLLPQDVVDIFAQEKHRKRGRKKRSRSLGRALGWLKGKKRNRLSANGQNPGLGPALDLALDGHPAGNQGGNKAGQKSGRQAHLHGNSHAGQKLDDNDKTPTPPLFQENVFIETSRPKYLEDLHTEALQGLKMMQEEETNNGVEYQDSESTISMMTNQTDGESAGFMTDSTIPDTSSVASVQTSVSTRSSRSGLTRQGSTFRPLNSGKKSEKTKGRRRHRKTVVGIPHHVQRELGLDRVDWTLAPKLDEEQLFNGETDYSQNTDRQQMGSESEGTSANVPGMSIIQPLNKENVKQLGATHARHRDDLALLHHLGSALEDDQRPRSLAVPWLTTASSLQQELPSPVMSMSPQAAYMSKIIPNAVLPPSIDVVEISRGPSRSSVRTVSKSSLLLSSPAPSRASSRASSVRTTSSKVSTITSASRNNPPNLSDTSCWSNSDSSETLISDSSTISNSSTPKQKRSENSNASAKENKIQSSISKAPISTSNGRLIVRGDEVKKDGQFARSLSVTKPKRAPPPPSRSYSLHSRMKRQSHYPEGARIVPGKCSNSAPGEENEQDTPGSYPSKTLDSPGYNADTSSLDDSTGSSSVNVFKSQLQAMKIENAKKDVETVSQEKQEPLKENKLDRVISPVSGNSSQDGTSPQLAKQPKSSSPKHKKGFLAKLHKLFPGSSSAPPQEASKYKSTEERKPDSNDTVTVSPSVQALIELFNIPPPPKVHAPPPPPPEVWAHSLRSCELILGPPAPGKTYAIAKKNPKDRRQQRQSPSAAPEESAKSLVVERKHKNPSVTVNGFHVLEAKKVQESGILNAEVYRDSNERLAQNVGLNGHSKDEKGRVSDELNRMIVKAVEKRGERLGVMKEAAAKKTASQATEVKTTTDTLPAISFVRISPVDHPSQPLPRQTKEVVSVASPESNWPPPPPALAQVSPSGLNEIDFPLPPPPLFGDNSPVIPVQEPPKSSLSGLTSCTTTSVISVVKTESVKVITGPEPQKSSTSQVVAAPPLNIPPPPPYTAPPPPNTEVLPIHTNKVSLTLEEGSPPPPVEFGHVIPKQLPSPVIQDVPPPVKDISSTLVTLVSPSPAKEVSPPLLVEVSHLPPREVPASSSEEVTPPPSQENTYQSSEEAEPSSKVTPPQSVPPPPPLPSHPQSSEQKIKLPQENISFKSETNTVSNSILMPPQNIPPPPPIELLHQPKVVAPKTDVPQTQEAPKTDVPQTQEAPKTDIPQTQEAPKTDVPQTQEAPKTDVPTTQEVPPPPFEVPMPPPPPEASSPKTKEPVSSIPINIPLPPPLPVQGHASIKHQPIPLSTETKSQEQTSAPVVQEPMRIVTPSLLQMVKLRSVSNSPELPKTEEQPQTEVTISNQVPSSAISGEAPQKPIRRSLIMTSPAPIPPPETVPSQPTLPKSQSDVVIPASSSTVTSPKNKAYPAVNPTRSMNLQEAIRMRTAARSKESPASRLSLPSPTSPLDLHKSPSSTASFIFSKSNKKVVIDPKPVLGAKEDVQKVISEADKGVRVPPPVAKKPKTKGKEVETSEGMDQTPELETQQESIQDAAEKTNETAGTVGGGMSST